MPSPTPPVNDPNPPAQPAVAEESLSDWEPDSLEQEAFSLYAASRGFPGLVLLPEDCRRRRVPDPADTTTDSISSSSSTEDDAPFSTTSSVTAIETGDAAAAAAATTTTTTIPTTADDQVQN
jgi:cytoskeletal protein RodZ